MKSLSMMVALCVPQEADETIKHEMLALLEQDKGLTGVCVPRESGALPPLSYSACLLDP